jgi:hypothetical protein
MRIPSVVIIALCGACSGAPLSSPSPTPSAESYPASISREPTATKPKAHVEVEVPRFAQLDFDVEAEYGLRTRIIKSGAVYESRNAQNPIAPGTEESISISAIVMDPDTSANSPRARRLRLLCDSLGESRIAIWMDATSMATMTTAAIVLTPMATAATPKSDDSTPGLRLSVGSVITLTETQNEFSRVSWKDTWLSGSGWLPTTQLDVVYALQPSPNKEDMKTIVDGQLIHSTPVFNLPMASGQEVAKIKVDLAADSEFDSEFYVRRVGKPKNRHHLVRFEENDGAVVGWVPASALKLFAAKEITGSGSGMGRLFGQETIVTLPLGALLTSASTGEILGVVTRTDQFRCESECQSDAPIVEVSACYDQVRVRAITKP